MPCRGAGRAGELCRCVWRWRDNEAREEAGDRVRACPHARAAEELAPLEVNTREVCDQRDV